MGLAAALLLAYLAGSLNAAIVVLRWLGKGDPREAFSGNAGTTNVFRLAGRGWAALVLLLDLGRGAALAVLGIAFCDAGEIPWIGLALVIGNRFPCFHRFRGGKGVAGYLGFVLPIAPATAGAACLAWVLVHRISRQPFIASGVMVLMMAGGVGGALGLQPAPVAGTAATAALILWAHRGNLVAYLAERRRTKREGG